MKDVYVSEEDTSVLLPGGGTSSRVVMRPQYSTCFASHAMLHLKLDLSSDGYNAEYVKGGVFSSTATVAGRAPTSSPRGETFVSQGFGTDAKI